MQVRVFGSCFLFGVCMGGVKQIAYESFAADCQPARPARSLVHVAKLISQSLPQRRKVRASINPIHPIGLIDGPPILGPE